jgi:hypothetical protein
MASPDEGSPLSARSGGRPVEVGHEEAYGPITIRRYVKDDGRALALYSRGTPRETHGEPGEDARGEPAEDTRA